MNPKGLTLVEVLVAGLILSMSVGCVLYVFSLEHAGVGKTGRKVQALNFSAQAIEYLKDDVGADTWDGSGYLDSGLHNTEPFLLSIGVHSLGIHFGGTRTYNVTDLNLDGSGDVDLKQVTVTVDWTDP